MARPKRYNSRLSNVEPDGMNGRHFQHDQDVWHLLFFLHFGPDGLCAFKYNCAECDCASTHAVLFSLAY